MMSMHSPFPTADDATGDVEAPPWHRALLQALPLGICLVDRAGRIVSLNGEGERLLGWSEAACSGMVWHDLVTCWGPAAGTEPAICPTASVLHSGRPMWLPSTMLRCRSGTFLPVEYTCLPLSAHTGTGAVVSFRDLRMQLQMENDLQRLASVPAESPLPIVELDANMHMTYANAAMLNLLAQCGFNAQALPAILPPDVASIVQECRRSGCRHKGAEGAAAGQYFVWTFCPVQHADVVRGYGVDLTEQKQAEQVLLASRDALLEAWRLKSEFVANISHELRTPLNGILGMTQLVLDSPLDDEQRSDLLLVRESADTLLGLVNQLLDFAGLESGQLDLNSRPFALRAALCALLPPLQQQARHKGLRFTLDILPTVPDILCGDAERLQQVVLSLVQNAIKFTTHGDITVQVTLASCTAQSVTLHWSVHDTGIGLTTEQQHFIFDAFRQGDGSSTRPYGGMGLGLTIAAQLVMMMGGELWVDSSGPGRGSIFHFTACFGVPAEAVIQSSLETRTRYEAASLVQGSGNVPYESMSG